MDAAHCKGGAPAKGPDPTRQGPSTAGGIAGPPVRG